MRYSYKILLTKEDEGGYMVTVPALPGCITQGDNIEEAMAMAQEAIELYIEELQAEEKKFLIIATPWNILLIWKLHEPVTSVFDKTPWEKWIFIQTLKRFTSNLF